MGSAPPSDPAPRTRVFRKLRPNRYSTRLQGPCWNQYAYQFDMNSVMWLSGYEDLAGNPNNWFHETICELASMFTLSNGRAVAHVSPLSELGRLLEAFAGIRCEAAKA